MAKDWIQGAIKRPGALRAKAKKAGAITPEGTIKKSWIKKKEAGGGRTARQARLAETLSLMRRKK